MTAEPGRAFEAGRLAAFLALVAGLSTPFWLLEGLLGDRADAGLPAGLPLSALMAPAPAVAALILTGAEGRARLLAFLQTSLDPRIGPPRVLLGLAAVMLLLPAVVILSAPAGAPADWGPLAGLVGLFLAAALAEEIGWQGYAAPRLLQRWSAARAGLLLGAVWALWHVPAYLQAGRSLDWIAWQVLFTVAARVVMTALAARLTRGAVAAATLFHAMINVAVFAAPGGGMAYDPMIPALALSALALLLTARPGAWRGRAP